MQVLLFSCFLLATHQILPLLWHFVLSTKLPQFNHQGQLHAVYNEVIAYCSVMNDEAVVSYGEKTRCNRTFLLKRPNVFTWNLLAVTTERI